MDKALSRLVQHIGGTDGAALVAETCAVLDCLYLKWMNANCGVACDSCHAKEPCGMALQFFACNAGYGGRGLRLPIRNDLVQITGGQKSVSGQLQAWL